MKRLALILGLSLASPLFAEQVGVSSFRYLNNNDNSITLDPDVAQDLLNVDIRPGGKSVKKREGYGTYKDLVTDQGVHGGHHFFDTTGNDVQIWGSSTSLFGIVADGTKTQLVSSATLNATWDCADTQGYAYCVNSSRDVYLKTDGATKTWYTSPLGTMVEVTPERAVVAGVSGSASTLYFSESSVFTNFVVGIAETSPFTEVIASPGAKITHIRYGCGKVLWWKDQSFGYLTGSTQFDIENTIVSDNVGTSDNTSAMDPGGNVWFRGQDGHIWKYDCTALTKESIEITPLIQTSGRRTSNYWTQTSQTDFETGVSSGNTTSLNYSSVAGAVVLSTAPPYTATDTTADNFALGSTNNIDTTTVSGAFRLKRSTAASISQATSDTTIPFGAGPNSPDCYSPAFSSYYIAQSFITDGFAIQISSVTARLGCAQGGGTTAAPTSTTMRIKSDSSNSPGSDIATASISASEITSCSGTDITKTFNVSVSSNVRYWVYIDGAGSEFCDGGENTVAIWNTWYGTTASSYANGAVVTNGPAFSGDSRFQTNFNPGYKPIGSFTSQTFNVGYSTQVFISNWDMVKTDHSLNGGTIVYGVSSSTSTTGVWTTPVTIATGTALNVAFSQYVKYVATLTAAGLSTTPEVSSVTLSTLRFSKSSATYLSSVHNAPNITSWDTYSATQQLGDGTLTYYTRASTGSFTILSSTPGWVAQPNGGVVAASTGTYFQTRVDFAITAATNTPTLNDFTFNWFEGTATDQAYGTYFDNAIWFSVASGVGVSSNNYVFKYDLINEGWTLYSFGAGGFATQNNRLHFGQVGGDNVYRYGGSTSDAGSPITAFWKSKDYPGTDPFLQNAYDQIDTLWTEDTNQTATVTYTIDTSSATSYTVNLTSSTSTIINHRKLLPGKLGYTANWTFGDTSSDSAWELLGYRFTFSPQPYRPSK